MRVERNIDDSVRVKFSTTSCSKKVVIVKKCLFFSVFSVFTIDTIQYECTVVVLYIAQYLYYSIKNLQRIFLATNHDVHGRLAK